MGRVQGLRTREEDPGYGDPGREQAEQPEWGNGWWRKGKGRSGVSIAAKNKKKVLLLLILCGYIEGKGFFSIFHPFAEWEKQPLFLFFSFFWCLFLLLTCVLSCRVSQLILCFPLSLSPSPPSIFFFLNYYLFSINNNFFFSKKNNNIFYWKHFHQILIWFYKLAL